MHDQREPSRVEVRKISFCGGFPNLYMYHAHTQVSACGYVTCTKKTTSVCRAVWLKRTKSADLVQNQQSSDGVLSSHPLEAHRTGKLLSASSTRISENVSVSWILKITQEWETVGNNGVRNYSTFFAISPHGRSFCAKFGMHVGVPGKTMFNTET